MVKDIMIVLEYPQYGTHNSLLGLLSLVYTHVWLFPLSTLPPPSQFPCSVVHGTLQNALTIESHNKLSIACIHLTSCDIVVVDQANTSCLAY